MSRSSPRPLASVVRALERELAPASTLARVQEVWELAAGPEIAAAAQPTAERDGVLTLTCEASVWAQELDLMAPTILARLNQALRSGRLTRLRCVTLPPRL